MKLPDEFCRRMQYLLGDEYAEFLLSYEHPRQFGLRVNTLKISVQDFLKISPFTLTPIPWTENGFYFQEKERPAKHPYYYAGLYYIQEPSAMFPARVVGVEPGDRVLDLCAAPGGKSTQIALDLKGKGVLVSNDISLDRTKFLVKNLELFGVTNAIITNESPRDLAVKFPGFFTKILVDAPCSGEGMFRKDPDAVRQWGAYTTEKCTFIQRDILKFAAEMLSPGGKLVYSTCTFTPEENERMVSNFLGEHPDFFLQDIPKEHGVDYGRPEWADGNQELKKTARIWPHKANGEGHFVALFQKRGRADDLEYSCNIGNNRHLDSYFSFVKENFHIWPEGRYEQYANHLYLSPWEIPDLKGIRVVRPGFYLGSFKKQRFEPSHSIVMALKKESFRRIIDLPVHAPEVIAYLKGETLSFSGEKGWVVLCVNGYPLGWGKQLGSIIKNHYPKGRRWVV
ncbi:MAG: RsmF rRNA methyltransferase first C-terminal domain-containing protein [Bacillota bacterium]|jgi:NOL1/NOP2/sun family putative RNA methylase